MSQTLTFTFIPWLQHATDFDILQSPKKFIVQPEIKKAVTGVHFLSLMATGILYAMKHEKSSLVFRLAILTFCLAYIIPPVGMISPDDAPEYAKTSMSYLPKKVEISTEQLKGKGDKKNKEKGGKKKRRNKEE
mmetsp:Transcript_6309/g.12670  ORF Transcript_6309/g.12670 Transcript_6309/m.12670 type:complete len:133 (+) Transcript_6309:424-822(+)